MRLFLFLFLLLISGCEFAHNRNTRDIGVNVRTECRGDCECISEISGSGTNDAMDSSVGIGEKPTTRAP